MVTTLVQQYFGASAQRFPAKLAVSCAGDAVTYGDLERRSNARARELVRRGARRGDFVPVFLPKSLHAIEAILSILKADCAYVPLDAASPGPRIESILAATRARQVVVDDASEARLRSLCPAAAGLDLVNLDRAPAESDAPVTCANLSIDVAYVLFTSGSTGTPKGVLISHQMIVDYIEWCVATYAIDDRDVVANHAPLHFDNSTFDLYTAWKAGASLHLVHDDLNLMMPRLIGWLRERGVTVFFCVPSVLGILLKSGRLAPDSFPALRHVIAAGEVLPPEVVRRWMQLYPHVQFANMYGPTEITVDCTYHAIREIPEPDAAAIPIGRPRRNMEVFVRREDGTLSTEPGAEGEIVVRGASVSYGYLNDPDRTREAFVQNPRHDLFHDPLYCTGDLARIAPDGSLLFIGRRDQQIKFLGHRIELGEIESALRRIDGVLEAVAVFHDAPAIDDKCIGALLVLAPGTREADVAAALQGRLPSYMIPARIRSASDMPRTPNGKSDRKRAAEILFG